MTPRTSCRVGLRSPLKLDINKQITPLNTTFNLLIIDDDIYTAIETSINKLDYNNTNEATESLSNIIIK